MQAAAGLVEVGREVGWVAERAGGAVVGVGRGWRVGTGIVIAANRVLTAARHAGDGRSSVVFGSAWSERGELVGTDPDLGLAVLEASTGDVEPLGWPESDFDAEIGAPVIALSNPGGRGLRATPGFVSSSGRTFRGPRGRRVGDAIEHTAQLPRGSAGGPLVDLEGRLVGVNMLRTEGGLIVAIAAGAARASIERLARGEEVSRPALGVAVAPPWMSRKLRRAVGLPEREGVLVRAVSDGSSAERGGVAQGDLIVAAGGEPVDGIDALHRAIDAAAGDKLSLIVVRGADEHELEVDLRTEASA